MRKNTVLFAGITALALMVTGCGNQAAPTGTDGTEAKQDAPITVISREDGSGTRSAFIELTGVEEKGADGSKSDKTTKEAQVVSKTDVVLTSVSSNENAIGYVSMGSLSDSVKALNIDGVQATPENVKNGTYQLARPFNIAVKEDVSDLANDFISFILSKEGQAVVLDGYIAIDDAAPDYAGGNQSGKLVVAGSSSVTPVMEKLKEAYIAKNSGVQIEIQMTDSSSGITAATDGVCDIGMASRALTDNEKAALSEIQIALDGIAVIVNPKNAVDELSVSQIKDIYTGKTTTWDAVQ